MTEKQDKQAKQFKRLDLALVSFRECKALTQHLIELGIVPRSDGATLYSACCAGIVVTYARPFMAADGLGTLSPQYGKGFDPVALADTHRDLVHIRNTVFAHRDLVQTKNIPLQPGSDPGFFASYIILTPGKPGKGATIHSAPALLYIEESQLSDIITLCDFQIARASKAAVALLKDMAGTKAYRAGRYTVGVDFP